MPRNYIKQVSTTLFKGKASDFGAWSGLLEKHKGFSNHQLMLCSSGNLAVGSYNVRVIPDNASDVKQSVNTGYTLDPSGGNSALTTFDGVIQGIHLDPAVTFSAGETISVVLSSFMTIGPEAVGFNSDTAVTTTLLNNAASDYGSVSKITDRHAEMTSHQLSVALSGVVAAGVYRVRIIPLSDDRLESSVDTGKVLDLTGDNSAFVQFTAVLGGIHLEPTTPVTSGSVMSIVFSSSAERFDSLIGETLVFPPGTFPPHTHLEADIIDLDKYTQAQVDTLISDHETDANTHTNLIVDGQYF